jgi:hypothetical protein
MRTARSSLLRSPARRRAAFINPSSQEATMPELDDVLEEIQREIKSFGDNVKG